MANTESDRKEKDAAIVNEVALDGIAGGGGEGMEAGLNLGDTPGLKELVEKIEQTTKAFEDATRKL